jgi:predicted nucleotide-binding protein
MTRSRQPANPAVTLDPPALTRSRAEVTAQLQGRIKRGNELQARAILSDSDIEGYEQDAIKWRDYNSDLLRQLFTTDARRQEYQYSAMPSRVAGERLESYVVRRETVNNQIAKLESIVERLDLFRETVPAVATPGEAVGLEDRSKIFVVHGHDEGAREGVARFLEKIGLIAIILSEQPNRGRTIIEKFVDCAREVGFAVVLLTPDDLGGAAADEAQKSRARQNVIFELGYFVGSLGRGRACLLRKGEVEIPSDLYGVVYTTMNGGNGWKIELGRELKDAGFKFDASKVLA